MYSFGKKSMEKLLTCHEDLQKIMNLAISRSRVDFGISEGHRSEERQKELYQEGKTTVLKSMHNNNPSLACDIYAYHKDPKTRRKKQYDKGTLCYIAGVVVSCTKELLEKKEIEHTVRWGGNWDCDGEILTDHDFEDMPHFEIRTI